MAESETFSATCQALESSSQLDKLEARGTIRLALKSAGLEAADVRPDQMKVVVEKLLAEELTSRGVEDAAASCRAIHAAIEGIDAGDSESRAEEVFSRFGG